MAQRDPLLFEDGSGLEKGQPPRKLIRWIDAAPRRFKIFGTCVFITLNVLLTGALIDQHFDEGHKLGGGSHMAKVSGVLDYLNSLSPEQDEELVLMMDAYDIHLQLPKSVLTSRYYSTREAAQRRLVEYAGHNTVDDGNLQQLVVFGAGNRCAPNWPHTVACYAIPNSPLPEDLYGGNTDTSMGHNHWSSVRQRFLDSGYVLGPVGAMRRIFAEAWKEIQEWPETDPFDDGQRFSADVYRGSDQSVFAAMYGRQEWVREKLRLKHAPPGTKPRTSEVFGTVVDNALSPSFTHEPFDPDLSEGNPYEFGIYLDFWSELGHQTINSDWDAPLGDLRQAEAGRRTGRIQIGVGLSDQDLKEFLGEPAEKTWQEHKADSTLLIAGGAWTDKGELLKWEQLCPSDYDKEIFRDVKEPNT
ncbi:hypothetical protein DL766_005335 [Monosporascus sp. MC13-8B]|uniref:Uncharacterized protein n=1 Tax=Monosporascus cannonballus TaxID=155416 RepID=A0ABY0GZR7_9PEZI|nr:hypothetical protein DL762_007242 [Monosporascus cannonballus]RYP29531.1 hypothetical protein DL766_005335 [Monosporascus sp. MC13-8B]